MRWSDLDDNQRELVMLADGEDLVELADLWGVVVEDLQRWKREERGRRKDVLTSGSEVEKMQLFADFQDFLREGVVVKEMRRKKGVVYSVEVKYRASIRRQCLFLVDYGLTVKEASNWLGVRYQQVYNALKWREKLLGKGKGVGTDVDGVERLQEILSAS